jgi:hypothetical protein
VDTGDWTLLSLWIHIPVVTAWIGFVMLDLFASTAPGLSTEQRGRLIAWSRPFTIAAIVIILATGVWQTMKNPFIEVNSWDTLEDLRGKTYGLMLFFKHGAVIATFFLTLLVRFYFAPRLMQPAAVGAPGGPAVTSTIHSTAAEPVPRDLQVTRWLSALNLLACLAALLLATRMVWELH